MPTPYTQSLTGKSEFWVHLAGKLYNGPKDQCATCTDDRDLTDYGKKILRFTEDQPGVIGVEVFKYSLRFFIAEAYTYPQDFPWIKEFDVPIQPAGAASDAA